MARHKKPGRPKNSKSQKNKKPYQAGWEKVDLAVNPEIVKNVAGIVLATITIITLLAFFGLSGKIGVYINDFLKTTLGWAAYFFPLSVAWIIYALFNAEKHDLKIPNIVGVFGLLASIAGFFHIFVSLEQSLEVAKAGFGGGYVGHFLNLVFYQVLSTEALFVVYLGLIIVFSILAFNVSFSQIKSFFKKEEDLKINGNDKKSSPELKINNQNGETEPKKNGLTSIFVSKKEAPKNDSAPTLASSSDSKDLPSLDLLENKITGSDAGDVRKNAAVIKETLSHFSIDVEMVDVNVGPTVTQYTLKPSEGVKLNKIIGLSNDLALSLAAHPIRIEAPIPGKSLVGIEIPNKSRAIVRLREIFESSPWNTTKGILEIALGKDVSGEIHVSDIAKMPHMLVAGSTGSGKSIFVNTVLMSLLYKLTPSNLRLLLIDPKRVELTAYNNIPHLVAPVVTDSEKAVSALKWAVYEMENRYKLFEAHGKRDILSYNSDKSLPKMPYMVIVIDELADLMVVAAQEVETAIVRIAQMARATGIHLTIATQRPSVDVITGLIKANITNRIAFATASQIDSRTILDTPGSEKLLGAGDMLFLSSEMSKPRRLQSAFVSEQEIKAVTDFWREQNPPEYDEKVFSQPVKGKSNGGSVGTGEPVDDELFVEAAETVIHAGKGSASLLQRRLRIGYARAARLLDLLEDQGIIGPPDGARPRDVLVSSIDELNFSESKQNKGEDEAF